MTKLSSRSVSMRTLVAMLACLSALSGCAPIPVHDKPVVPKNVDQLASSSTFSATETAMATAWPRQDWWTAYGDAQLEELIEEALRDSPSLAIAEARLRQAGAMTQFMGASLLPDITASGNFNETKQSYNYLMPRQAVPQGWNDYGLATLNIAWELDFWGKNHAAVAAALSEQGAAAAEAAQTRLILSTSIASAYAELFHLHAVRDTAAEALALRTRTVELFRQRNEFGLENVASVRQVEARRAAAEGELRGVDERIALLHNALAALIGAGPDRALSITRPSVLFSAKEGLPANLALDLVGRRPDIVAARLRTEAAAKRIDQQKAGFYPSINLLAFVGVQSLGIDKLSKSGSNIGSIGPAISLPIFNTERLQGQLRGAYAEYDAAVAVYNATLTNALHEVADAATSRRALEGELASASAAVVAAAEAHAIVSMRYKGELATYLDVLSAEDQLVMARRGMADIKARAMILDVALVRALGGGFEEPDRSPAHAATTGRTTGRTTNES